MRTLLDNREFVRLFSGRLVTNAGDSLYYIAAMWLVYELTGSEFYTGVAAFLILAPSSLQFLFGPLVDRLPLRGLLVGTQVAQGVLVLAIPLAHLAGLLSVWVVLVVTPLLSLLNQPVYPAESAALPRIVEREELVAANSAFSLAYQGVDAGFNALAGLLVAAVGAIWLFALDSVTFAVAALLFAGLRVRGAERAEGTPTAERDETTLDTGDETAADGGRTDGGATSYLADLRAGIGYVRGTLITKVLVGSVGANAAFGAAMGVLPAYGDTLGGSAAYGFLIAGIGGGLFAGALVAGALDDLSLGALVIGGFLASAALWVAAVAASWLPATALLFALAFVPIGVTNVLLISMVQALVPEGLLGRVSAVMASASAGATPLGALVGGTAASALSTPVVVAATGVSFAVLAAYWFVSPRLRRLPRVGRVETLVVE